METTRGSGTIDATSAMPLWPVMTSVACVSFGIVLVGLSVVSMAIERTGLNWTTLALLVLLTFCGLGLIGIIVQLLTGRRGDQYGALDREPPYRPSGADS
jgi:apolipoprotein N-acyltransferase